MSGGGRPIFTYRREVSGSYGSIGTCAFARASGNRKGSSRAFANVLRENRAVILGCGSDTRRVVEDWAACCICACLENQAFLVAGGVKAALARTLILGA